MQQYSIAQIGRIIGLVVIGLGVILSIWQATDLGEFSDGDDKFRFFIGQSLTYLAWGAFVYLAAEIVDRLGSRSQ